MQYPGSPFAGPRPATLLLLLAAALAGGPAAAEPVTYCGRVAAILQRNCQACHRPGTAAPFSLLTYDDAVKWADSIREAVTDGRMPPWGADPHFGKFANDRRLAAADRAALVAWVDAGRERGDPRQLPPNPPYDDGWAIGTPDVVLELPEDQEIPASGLVPYRFVATPTGFKEDVWVQAAEVRPGNPRVVHHANVCFNPATADPAAAFGEIGGPGKDAGLLLGGVPGDWSWTLPPGEARRIPAGSHLSWQIHYVTIGTPAKDRSRIGLKFYRGKEPPRCSIHTVGLASYGFTIPPHAANHPVEVEWRVPRPMEVLSLNPHMHLRGKDVEYKVLYPDGRSVTLLFVPKYDFNWQLAYRLATPLPLPAGARVHCTAHFDNSAGNPANPDPAQTVRWGDYSTDEMMIAFLDVRTDEHGLGSFTDKAEGHQRLYVDSTYRPDVPGGGQRPAVDHRPPPGFLVQLLTGTDLADRWYLLLAGPPLLAVAVAWLYRRNRRPAGAKG